MGNGQFEKGRLIGMKKITEQTLCFPYINTQIFVNQHVRLLIFKESKIAKLQRVLLFAGNIIIQIFLFVCILLGMEG